MKTPYKIQIVLHISEHRVFTQIFRDRIRSQVRDLLRLQTGEAASVDVVLQHPKLLAVLSKGLRPGLNDWDDVNDTQTHFVLVTFEKGVYHIAARLHDGRTGLNSPAVRQAQTRDRVLVARTIVRVIQAQFSVVGTLVQGDGEMRMAVHGGLLNENVGKRVKPGDVFAVVRMRQTGEKRKGVRMEWVLVQAIDAPKNGFLRCRYHHRYPEDDLAGANASVEYRCLQWSTVKAPLRLQLIHADTFQPLSGWEVHIPPPTKGGKSRQMTTDSSGLVQSSEVYSSMVTAQVVKGNTIWAQLPIAMTSDRVVVCRVKPEKGAEELALWEVRRDGWVNRIYDSLYAAGERLNELNRQIPVSLEAALETAKSGAKATAGDVFKFTAQRDRLEAMVQRGKLAVGSSEFEEGKQRLEDLGERQKLFERLAAELEVARKETEKAKALEKELVKARLLENQALVDQAIAICERALKKAPKRAEKKLHKYLQGLRAAWKIRNVQHGAARDFIYKEWPHFKIDDLVAQFPIAKKSLAAAVAAKDRFSIRKMEIVNLAYATQLKKTLDALKQKDTPDNRAKAKIIAALAAQFRELHTEIRAFLKQPKN